MSRFLHLSFLLRVNLRILRINITNLRILRVRLTNLLISDYLYIINLGFTHYRGREKDINKYVAEIEKVSGSAWRRCIHS